MKKSAFGAIRVLLVALCLGAVPTAAFSQIEEPREAAAPTGPPDAAAATSPLDLLLERRGALALTSAQVGDLEQIRDRLVSTNDPLVQQMMTLRSQWQQARRAARNGRAQAPERIERIRLQAERIRERIQQNNRDAMQRVNRMLTPPQRRQLRSIVQERRQQTPGRRAGGGPNADGRD